MYKKILSFLNIKKNTKYDLIISSIKKIYHLIPVDFGGGCSYQKALTLYLFIKEFNYKSTADIGVYRGRSLFPQALAHQYETNGIVYGIDPFDTEAADQNDNPGIKTQLDNFLQTTDFNLINKEVNEIITNFDLHDNCQLLRQKSHDAALFFVEQNIKLDLIHIDGNHDTFFVSQDVHDYLPLLNEGGIILLDDISWSSVKPAFDILKSNLTYIGSIVDGQNDFAIFFRGHISNQIKSANKIYKSIKNYNY